MLLSDLIFEANVAAGLSATGDSLPPEEANYGWRKLNDLLDLLKTNRLAMYRRQRVGTFSVTAGQGDITASAPITIGSGATWDTPRPIWIDRAGVIYTAGSTPRPELAMRVFTVKEWAEVTVKGITSTLSRALIYDQNFTSGGFGYIYLYPVPSASFQVVLYTPEWIDEFAVDVNGNPDFSIVIALPPGHRMMLISNLAKILCIGVKTVDPDLERLATDSLADVKTSNVVQNMDALSCDAASRQGGGKAGGSWNWLDGGFQ